VEINGIHGRTAVSKQQPWLIFTSIGLICLAGSGPGLALAQDKGEPKPAPKLIDRKTQEAIDAGLEFLAKNQHADGSWGTGNFKGSVTGLAGRAFLAFGSKPGEGKYGKELRLALQYVIGQQDPRGFLANPQGQMYGPMYGHGFGTHFLAEVLIRANATPQGYGADPEVRKKLDGTLRRAVEVIVNSQNTEGGWRYLPRPWDADISVTSVQIMALHAAANSGLDIPRDVKEKYLKYVKECRDVESGGFKYQKFGGRPGFARSAAAVFVLQNSGEGDSDEVKKGLDYLKKLQPFMKEDGLRDPEARLHYFYGHYYATQAMQIVGGDQWHKWYGAVRDDLITHSGFRKADGSWADPNFCPHYCTAMALLILQAPRKNVK
jgi:hypothetical protein